MSTPESIAEFAAVVFDLDGTLLDTLADISGGANAVLARRGHPAHEDRAYRYMVGEGAEHLFLRALPERCRDAETVSACVREYVDEYRRAGDPRTRPYDGIPELLDALAARGVRLAVLSNKADEFVRRCVERFLPRWRFEAVEGQRPGTKRKPDPGGALAVAARMNLRPDRFLYLGDTATDMQTAVAAGMFPVGALWGFREREELMAAGAKALVGRPGEVVELLGRAGTSSTMDR